MEQSLKDIKWAIAGERPKASYEERIPAPPSIDNRLYSIAYANRNSLSDVTATQKEQFEILKKEFPPILERMKMIYNNDIPNLEKALDQIGAPWTPGRVLEWKFD